MSALPPNADVSPQVPFGLDHKQSVAACLLAHFNFGPANRHAQR
jgi:hypothetical protein